MNIIFLTFLFFTQTIRAEATDKQPLDQAACQKLAQALYGSIKSVAGKDDIATMAVCRKKYPNPKQDKELLKLADGYDPATLEKFQKVLISGANIDAIGYGGNNVLHFLVSKPYQTDHLIQFFIDHGIYINGQDDDGKTPLHTAAEYNNQPAIGQLVTNNANPNIKDRWGKTVFDYQQLSA